MERQLRDNIGFEGTPLRLLWRGKPASDRSRPEGQQQQGQGQQGQQQQGQQQRGRKAGVSAE